MPTDDEISVEHETRRLASQLASLRAIQAGVAHDLKSPLNAIVLNLELLKRSSLDPSSAEASVLARRERWVAAIEHEMARLRAGLDLLLGQLLPDSGASGSFDLREVLEQLRDLLGAQGRQQRIALELALPEEPLPVRANRPAVAEALLALLVERFESAPTESRIVAAGASRAGDAELTIRAPVGAPDAARESGSGPTALGRSVAREILARAGGGLEVRDEGGAEITIHIRLPLADREGNR